MADIWTWIGALLTLSILSFLYKDNVFYKFAEHLFVGVSAAYWMVIGIWGTLFPNLIAKIYPEGVRFVLPSLADREPEYHYLIAAVLGVILLLRLFPKIGWVSRWALAFIVGTTAGLNLVRYLRSDFIGQVQNSMIPLVVFEKGSLNLLESLSNTILIGGLLCGLVYFFFSKEHKGAIGTASRIGIWVLMMTFGAGFGYTVMARISLLVGRFQYLFADWLGIIGR